MKKLCGKLKFKAAAALVAFVVCLPVALSSCGQKIDFTAEYYYVCYRCPSDALSASSISSLVESYGGAGYIVCVEGEYYVTISAYYVKEDALSVAQTLNAKQLPCEVVAAVRRDYSLPATLRREGDGYLSDLKTLHSLSVMCYELANSMEEGETDQNSAKTVLRDVQYSVDGLERKNIGNSVGDACAYISAECTDITYGFILPGDVRRLQVVLCDAIINM